MYQLLDDNIWNGLPKDNKIEGIDLYDKENTVQETKKYNLLLLNFLNDNNDENEDDDILPCEGEI
jgi:hypothetical protein